MKTLILTLILLIASVAYPNEENPSRLIEKIIEEIKPSILNKNNELLEKTMEKYIDFNEIAIWIIGKHTWLITDEKKKELFIHELKKLMLKTYSKTVYYYIDANVQFLTPNFNNTTITKQKRIQISSVMKKNNKDINISYRLIKNESSWLIFDIAIEGISILKSLKTQYSDIIKTKGLEHTIQKMKKINES